MNRQVILITGCSSGIGNALVRELQSNGHLVYAGARNIDSLENIVCENVIPVELDVNDPGQVSRAVTLIECTSGKLDCLINNAGYGAMGPLLEMPLDSVEAQFRTNVFSPLHLIQAFTPLLLRSECAQVANIGSAAGVFSTPFSGAYCASKAALHSISEVLRMELAPLGIHVKTVYPGAVASSFGDNASKQLDSILVDGSVYRPLEDAIQNRAKVSQNSPTTPASFAKQLSSALFAKKPYAESHIGHGSTLMLVAKSLLPLRLREWLLRRAYGLDRLNIKTLRREESAVKA